VVVEPSVSNMGYVSTVLTPEQRERSGPKNGAQATATVSLDPVGSVNVHVASVPQGQGHRTVLAIVVGEVLGLEPSQVRVNTDLDTGRDAWSIASGNYASRFAAAVAGTAKIAAERLRDRLANIAASSLNVPADAIEFCDGRIQARGNPDNALPFARVAATSHWAPATVPDLDSHALRETAFWTPPELTAPDDDDRVNSSLCHGFIFDFCGVEVDRDTGQARIDRYVSAHDCGRILHRGMVDGQIRGSYANAIGAALYEEYAYSSNGDFLAGTFADYLVPTAAEVPPVQIIHTETPSPFTPLGAKGVGEGNCMSTPVALANAVTDALGVSINTLPMTPTRLRRIIAPTEPAAPPDVIPVEDGDGERLRGDGEVLVAATREALWAALLDPDTLKRTVPGCHAVRRLSDTRFEAEATLGAGPVKGRFAVGIELSDLIAPESMTIIGRARGPLGVGAGQGTLELDEVDSERTRLRYRYDARVGGKVAAVGARMLDGASRLILNQFFAALAATTRAPGTAWWVRLWQRLRSP
jgi:2-furoyl-CoA dehydrogenase large subunit